MPLSSLFRMFLLAAIWGGSFIFLRVAVPVLGAVPVTAVRVVLASAGLYLLLLAMRVPRDYRDRLPAILLLGVMNSGVPFLLFASAATVLPAGYSAILNATVPLMGVIIGGLAFNERFTASKIAGVLIGFGGVVVLAGAGPVEPTLAVSAGVLACLLATLCYGTASFLTRRWITERGGLDNRLVALGSQAGAMLTLLPVAAVYAATQPIAWQATDAKVGASLLALGLLCTSVAYILYFRLLADIGPLRSLTVTFLIPVFGVFWGWLWLGEPAGWAHLAGGSLIAVALWLVLRPSPAPPQTVVPVGGVEPRPDVR